MVPCLHLNIDSSKGSQRELLLSAGMQNATDDDKSLATAEVEFFHYIQELKKQTKSRKSIYSPCHDLKF